MGYNTDFTGQFNLDKPLKPSEQEYLHKFLDQRHMKRDASKFENQSPNQNLGLGLGVEGEFVVGSRDLHVLDYNSPASTQPSLWCDWEIQDKGTKIGHNGGEKFYGYEEWLVYIIENFLKPWGYVLSGQVQWSGEDMDDAGTLFVKDNVVSSVTFKQMQEHWNKTNGEV